MPTWNVKSSGVALGWAAGRFRWIGSDSGCFCQVNHVGTFRCCDVYRNVLLK